MTAPPAYQRAVLRLAVGLELRPVCRLVLALVAMHANPRTGRSSPSLAGMAELAGCSEKTVTRAVLELEASGLFAVSRRNGSRNVYRLPLNVPKLSTTTDSQGVRGAQPSTTDIPTLNHGQSGCPAKLGTTYLEGRGRAGARFVSGSGWVPDA